MQDKLDFLNLQANIECKGMVDDSGHDPYDCPHCEARGWLHEVDVLVSSAVESVKRLMEAQSANP